MNLKENTEVISVLGQLLVSLKDNLNRDLVEDVYDTVLTECDCNHDQDCPKCFGEGSYYENILKFRDLTDKANRSINCLDSYVSVNLLKSYEDFLLKNTPSNKESYIKDGYKILKEIYSEVINVIRNKNNNLKTKDMENLDLTKVKDNDFDEFDSTPTPREVEKKQTKVKVELKDVKDYSDLPFVEGTNDYKPVSKGWLIFVTPVSLSDKGPFLVQQVTDKTVCVAAGNRVIQFNLETGEERGASKIGMALAESTLKVLRCNIKYNSKIHKKLIESSSEEVNKTISLAEKLLLVPAPTSEEVDFTKKLIVSPGKKETPVKETKTHKVVSENKSTVTLDSDGNPLNKEGKRLRSLNEILEDLKKRYDETDDPEEKNRLEEKITSFEEKAEESRKRSLKKEDFIGKGEDMGEFSDGDLDDFDPVQGDDFDDFNEPDINDEDEFD